MLDLLNPLSGFSLLLFVALTHLDHLTGRFQRIQYLEVDDITELQKLFFFVVFLLVFDVDGCFGHLVAKTSKLLFKLLLLHSDILLLLLQFTDAVAQPFELGTCEEHSRTEIFRQRVGLTHLH